MPGLSASVSRTAFGLNALPRSLPFVRTAFNRIAEHLGRAEMTDVVRTPTDNSTELEPAPAHTDERSRTGLSADALRRGIVDHLRYSIGRPSGRDREMSAWTPPGCPACDRGRPARLPGSSAPASRPPPGSRHRRVLQRDLERAACHRQGLAPLRTTVVNARRRR
jgi:hypothetical protein